MSNLGSRILFKGNTPSYLKKQLEAALIFANEMSDRLENNEGLKDSYNEFKKDIIVSRMK